MERQLRLLELIDTAHAYRIDGPHDSVVRLSGKFVPLLLRALADVEARLPARAIELPAAAVPVAGE